MMRYSKPRQLIHGWSKAILSEIVAHYVIDAIFFAFPLLKSGNPYYVTSGLIVCLLAAVPLLLGLPGILRRE